MLMLRVLGTHTRVFPMLATILLKGFWGRNVLWLGLLHSLGELNWGLMLLEQPREGLGWRSAGLHRWSYT
jgi:hypothetical protein